MDHVGQGLVHVEVRHRLAVVAERGEQLPRGPVPEADSAVVATRDDEVQGRPHRRHPAAVRLYLPQRGLAITASAGSWLTPRPSADRTVVVTDEDFRAAGQRDAARRRLCGRGRDRHVLRQVQDVDLAGAGRRADDVGGRAERHVGDLVGMGGSLQRGRQVRGQQSPQLAIPRPGNKLEAVRGDRERGDVALEDVLREHVPMRVLPRQGLHAAVAAGDEQRAPAEREARAPIVAYGQGSPEDLGAHVEDADVSCRRAGDQEAVVDHAADVLPLQARRRKLHRIAAQRVAHRPDVEGHAVHQDLRVVGRAQLVGRVPAGGVRGAPSRHEARALGPSRVHDLTSGDVPNEDHLVGTGSNQKPAVL
mmetsp:Transcript_21880/g.65227  ORF Transcript_21880/g.65227 Transcript_21880/m.65227 type:complete len:363 (-) Transcript_21880:342-1430(-)